MFSYIDRKEIYYLFIYVLLFYYINSFKFMTSEPTFTTWPCAEERPIWDVKL